MKIAHISDLHTGQSVMRDALITRQIASIRESNIDHLIITGDLTQSGRQNEFEKIVAILDHHGFNSSDKLTVMPGNHDLFRFFFANFQYLRDFRKKLHRVPKAAMEIYNYGWRHYEKDLAHFNAYFSATFKDVLHHEDLDVCGYPFIKLLNGAIALVALESNHLLPQIKTNSICSNGYIDAEKTDRILCHDKLKDKIKIILLHHHLTPEQNVRQRDGKWFASTIKLKNRQEIIEILTKYQVDLILHGHYHYHEHYRLNQNSLNIVNNGDYKSWSLIHFIDDSIKITSKSSI
jgi:3',5'-cyclic AMP phosphodiesterase CpdA